MPLSRSLTSIHDPIPPCANFPMTSIPPGASVIRFFAPRLRSHHRHDGRNLERQDGRPPRYCLFYYNRQHSICHTVLFGPARISIRNSFPNSGSAGLALSLKAFFFVNVSDIRYNYAPPAIVGRQARTFGLGDINGFMRKSKETADHPLTGSTTVLFAYIPCSIAADPSSYTSRQSSPEPYCQCVIFERERRPSSSRNCRRRPPAPRTSPRPRPSRKRWHR